MRVYHHIVNSLFGLTERDVDDDIRQRQHSIVDGVTLERKQPRHLSRQVTTKITHATTAAALEPPPA